MLKLLRRMSAECTVLARRWKNKRKMKKLSETKKLLALKGMLRKLPVELSAMKEVLHRAIASAPDEEDIAEEEAATQANARATEALKELSRVLESCVCFWEKTPKSVQRRLLEEKEKRASTAACAADVPVAGEPAADLEGGGENFRDMLTEVLADFEFTWTERVYVALKAREAAEAAREVAEAKLLAAHAERDGALESALQSAAVSRAAAEKYETSQEQVDSLRRLNATLIQQMKTLEQSHFAEVRALKDKAAELTEAVVHTEQRAKKAEEQLEDAELDRLVHEVVQSAVNAAVVEVQTEEAARESVQELEQSLDHERTLNDKVAELLEAFVHTEQRAKKAEAQLEAAKAQLEDAEQRRIVRDMVERAVNVVISKDNSEEMLALCDRVAALEKVNAAQAATLAAREEAMASQAATVAAPEEEVNAKLQQEDTTVADSGYKLKEKEKTDAAVWELPLHGVHGETSSAATSVDEEAAPAAPRRRRRLGGLLRGVGRIAVGALAVAAAVKCTVGA